MHSNMIKHVFSWQINQVASGKRAYETHSHLLSGQSKQTKAVTHTNKRTYIPPSDVCEINVYMAASASAKYKKWAWTAQWKV